GRLPTIHDLMSPTEGEEGGEIPTLVAPRIADSPCRGRYSFAYYTSGGRIVVVGDKLVSCIVIRIKQQLACMAVDSCKFVQKPRTDTFSISHDVRTDDILCQSIVFGMERGHIGLDVPLEQLINDIGIHIYFKTLVKDTCRCIHQHGIVPGNFRYGNILQ